MTRVGVIGMGRWGRILIAAFSKLADVPVCASTGGATGRDWLSGHYPGVRWAPDARMVFRDPAIDAVVIATPIPTHAVLAEQALRAGKHVWVEKPLATAGPDAARLITLAGRHDLQLFVGYTFLFDPAYAELRARTTLDEVMHMRLSWRKKGLAGIPLVWNLLPHDVAICMDVFGGPPIGAARPAGRIPPESDSAAIELGFPGGRSAAIDVSRMRDRDVKRIDAVTRGGKTYRWEDGSLFERAGSGETLLLARDPAEDAVSREARAFLSAVTTREPAIGDPRFSLKVTRILEGLIAHPSAEV